MTTFVIAMALFTCVVFGASARPGPEGRKRTDP